MNDPKILIIGQSFNSNSGGGITMTNLFQGWNKENIAVAGSNIINPDFSICNNYYQLGSSEIKKKFPFNLIKWSKEMKSGVIAEKKNNHTYSFKADRNKIPRLKKIYINFLYFSGLIYYKNYHIVSHELLEWIKNFSPDIIYSQLSTLDLIRLVNHLNIKLDKPIIIHMMDDWPSTISSNTFFRSYWHKKIDKEFRELVDKSSLLMSISEGMSLEYKKRYGKTFLPFHNPINLDDWLPYSKNNWDVKSTFKVLYTGRIGTANTKSTRKIAEAVAHLVNKGLNITFDIYSPDINSPNVSGLNSLNGVTLKNAVPYDQIPSLVPSYDLLALSLDFDDESLRFAKLSIPTKASEYMISGAPILVWAPKQTALAEYAEKEKWAYLVSDNNKSKIIEALEKIYSSKLMRKQLGEKAKALAITTEDANVIRKRFKNAIYSVTNC